MIITCLILLIVAGLVIILSGIAAYFADERIRYRVLSVFGTACVVCAVVAMVRGSQP